MSQDVTGQNTGYLPIVKKLSCRCTDKCKQVIVKLIIPQSKKSVILGINIYKERLTPLIHKSSSCIGLEITAVPLTFTAMPSD